MEVTVWLSVGTRVGKFCTPHHFNVKEVDFKEKIWTFPCFSVIIDVMALCWKLTSHNYILSEEPQGCTAPHIVHAFTVTQPDEKEACVSPPNKQVVPYVVRLPIEWSKVSAKQRTRGNT